MAWLNEGYAAGRFLVSGRQIPRTGGVILATGDDRDEIEALAATDPFVTGGVATCEVVRVPRLADGRRAGAAAVACHRHGPRPTDYGWHVDTPEQPEAPRPPADPPHVAASASSALAVPDPSGPPSPLYPARLEFAYPAELNRFLPLVKWLLLIPHVIALFFVGIGAVLVAIFGFFAVLFTGRWPLGAFEYMVGTFRWGYRVSAYFHLMTDAYPPFSLNDDPATPSG